MAKGKRERTEADATPRHADGKWVKGVSANPGGVPPWLKAFRDAFGERCAPKAEAVLNRILDRAMDTSILDAVLEGNDVEAKLAAEKRILDRLAQGGTAADIVLKYLVPKPTAPQEVTVSDKRDAFAGLSAEQLVELAKHKPEEGT